MTDHSDTSKYAEPEGWLAYLPSRGVTLAYEVNRRSADYVARQVASARGFDLSVEHYEVIAIQLVPNPERYQYEDVVRLTADQIPLGSPGAVRRKPTWSESK